MDLTEKIKSAHDAVTAAQLPEVLREPAFTEVLRHLLGGATTPPGLGGNGSAPAVPKAPTSSALGLLAAKAKVDEEALTDIFDFEGDSVILHVSSSRISTKKSQATREIAILVALARQGGGLDEAWTSVSHVREALQNYNRYDGSNFSANMKTTSDVFNFRGKPAALEIRLTRPGWETASEFLRSLIAPSD